jgi:hypothetical protein
MNNARVDRHIQTETLRRVNEALQAQSEERLQQHIELEIKRRVEEALENKGKFLFIVSNICSI